MLYGGDGRVRAGERSWGRGGRKREKEAATNKVEILTTDGAGCVCGVCQRCVAVNPWGM